jgi:hypothetical protein
MSEKREKIIYEEKQYLGQNHFSTFIRMILAIFCFVAYYWSQNPKPYQTSLLKIGSYPLGEPEQTGQVFFLVGLIILMISIVLMFVVHSRIILYETYLVVDGFWGTRRVLIDLSKIRKIRKSRYKNILFRRAVYNLHKKNIIRFYTFGRGFVELVHENGITYKIGTQKPSLFFNLLREQIVKSQNIL